MWASESLVWCCAEELPVQTQATQKYYLEKNVANKTLTTTTDCSWFWRQCWFRKQVLTRWWSIGVSGAVDPGWPQPAFLLGALALGALAPVAAAADTRSVGAVHRREPLLLLWGMLRGGPGRFVRRSPLLVGWISDHCIVHRLRCKESVLCAIAAEGSG